MQTWYWMSWSPAGYFVHVPSVYQNLNHSRLPTGTGTTFSGPMVPPESALDCHGASTGHNLFTLGARQAEGLSPPTRRAPLAVSQREYGFSQTEPFFSQQTRFPPIFPDWACSELPQKYHCPYPCGVHMCVYACVFVFVLWPEACSGSDISFWVCQVLFQLQFQLQGFPFFPRLISEENVCNPLQQRQAHSSRD